MKIVIPDPFIDAYIEQGRAIGEARMLLRYLDTRFIVTEDARKRVTECTDIATIEAWFDKAVAATTLDEIFAD